MDITQESHENSQPETASAANSPSSQPKIAAGAAEALPFSVMYMSWGVKSPRYPSHKRDVYTGAEAVISTLGRRSYVSFD